MSNIKDFNFLSQFRDQTTKKLQNFTASQFAEVWNHYDKDGNGYIEGDELDLFLKEFVSSVVSENISEESKELNKSESKGETSKILSETAMKALKNEIMDAYDDNNDGRIEIYELAQILPMEENFLLLFRRDNQLESSVDFIKVWRMFDKNQSGFIEANELKEFLKHLLKEAKPTEDTPKEKIDEYTKIILQLFDYNKDGKLQLSEMARLLPVRENFLCRPIFKNASRITRYEIEKLFTVYDQDHSGTIENEELDGFLKDLMEIVQEEYDDHDLQFLKKTLLNQWNKSADAKITKDDLQLILMQQNRMYQSELSLRKK